MVNFISFVLYVNDLIKSGLLRIDRKNIDQIKVDRQNVPRVKTSQDMRSQGQNVPRDKASQ